MSDGMIEEPVPPRPGFLWGEEGDPSIGFVIGIGGKYRMVFHPEFPPDPPTIERANDNQVEASR